MKKEINLFNLPFELEFSTGQVLSVKSQNITQTQGTGGGGTISTNIFGNTHGKIDAVNISSYNTNIQDLHYASENGSEQHLRLINTDIPLREGQNIEIVKGNHNGKSLELFLINHNLEKIFNITNNEALLDIVHEAKNNHSRIIKIVGTIAAIISFSILYLSKFSMGGFIGGLLVGGFTFYLLYGKVSGYMKNSIAMNCAKEVNQNFRNVY